MGAPVPAEHLRAAITWDMLCEVCPDWASASMAAGVVLALEELHPDLGDDLRRFLAWGGTARSDHEVAQRIAAFVMGPAVDPPPRSTERDAAALEQLAELGIRFGGREP